MPRKKNEEVKEAVLVEEKKKTKKSTKQKETVITEENVDTQTEVINQSEETIKKETKPYFFPRLVAYMIDVLIISVICSGILLFFPENENYDKYMQEYEQIQTEAIENNTPFLKTLELSSSVLYDIDYCNTLPMIVEVVGVILYFIVFQFYNKGQTFGKKIMKLRLVSASGEPLNMNQVAIHAIFINSILTNILIIASLLLIGRDYYFYASLIVQLLDIIFVFATLMMILFRKDGRGFHDILAKTKVVQEN